VDRQHGVERPENGGAAGHLQCADVCGVVLHLFRMFSKNLYKRREENSKFLQKTWKLRNQISGAKARHADKDHKYFTCKQCKTVCRVPVGKGKIIITCPKCGAKIEARS
jgi:RNase P subunit RPR2